MDVLMDILAQKKGMQLLNEYAQRHRISERQFLRQSHHIYTNAAQRNNSAFRIPHSDYSALFPEQCSCMRSLRAARVSLQQLMG